MTADRTTESVVAPSSRRGRWPLRRSRTLAARRLPALAVLVVLLGAGAAVAAWASFGQVDAPVPAATVNAAAAPTVSYSGSALSVGWNPVTLSDGTPVDRYEVLRHAGATTTVVCTATAPTLTCLDPNPLVGTVQYGVVARKSSNWAGPEGPLTSFTSDQVKPVTNASASPAANGAGWNTTSVTVTLTASDSGGSGVKHITYAVDGDPPVTVTGSSASFPVSKQGSFDVAYYAEDHAGNVEATQSLPLKIDTVAPAAPVLTAISNDTGSSASDGITNASNQTVSGTAEPGSTVVVERGTTTLAAVVANGAGTFTTGSITLVDGDNTFTATATDAAGNVSSVSTGFVVTLDQSAPPTPAFTALDSDTGFSTTDGITSVASQTLSGTAEADSTVTVRQTAPGPAATLGTTSAGGSGTFTYGHTFTVNQSTTLVATATDAAGNVSVSSNDYPVVVDQLAPTHSVTSVTPAPNAAGWSKSATSVVIESSDVGPAGTYSVSTKLNTGSWGTSDNATTRTESVTAEGTNTILYYSTDRAGNTVGAAGASTRLVRLDSVVPSAPTIASISNDTGTSGTDRITNVATQTVSGTAEANSTVSLTRGGSTIATGTANGSGGFAIPVTLVEGTNGLTATATDVADNTSTASTPFVVTLDSTMATPTFTGISSDSGASNSDEITNVATQTLTGTAEPNSSVVVRRGTTTLATVTATTGGTFSVGVTLNGGVNSFTATAGDVAGNSAASATYPVTLDTTAPAAPTVSSISNDTGVSSTDQITNVTAQNIVGAAEANSTVTVRSGTTVMGSATADGSGAFAVPVTLSDGSTTLTATATDLAGNVSGASAGLLVRVDRTLPLAAITFPVNGATYTPSAYAAGCSARGVCGTASDPTSAYVSSLDTIRLRLQRGSVCLNSSGTFTTAACSTPLVVAVASPWLYRTPALTAGSYTATVTVTDRAGNVTTRAVTFTIQ